MRMMLATFATAALATTAAAQSSIPIAERAAVSGLKTYWSEKPDGCQPMVSFTVKNIASQAIGPLKFRLEVIDKDKASVFASGGAVVSSSELPPGRDKEIAIGGDHKITPHECLGDMHEAPFSTIHFAARLTAGVGEDAKMVSIVQDEPMTDQLVHAQD